MNSASQEAHLTEEMLSAAVDGQLSAEERAAAEQHLHRCAACQERRADLERVVALLGELPELDPPRAFTIGPRAAVDRANAPTLFRLRRWYLAARIGTAAAAALCVALLAGSFLVPGPVGSVALAPAADTRAAAPGGAPGAAARAAPRAAAPFGAQPFSESPGSPVRPTPEPARAVASQASPQRDALRTAALALAVVFLLVGVTALVLAARLRRVQREPT